jgi:hypothetical protein
LFLLFQFTRELSRASSHALKISAITFGRRVIVSPALVRRDDRRRLIIPGWLLAHEAIHVLQYERNGFLRFLIAYLRAYLRALREQKGIGAAARMNAYLAIEEEQSAREAERAYRVWRADSSFITGEK